MRLVYRILLTLALSFTFFSLAKADPVQITSGLLGETFPLNGGNSSTFRFAGNGLQGSGGNGGSNSIVQYGQGFCISGCMFGSSIGASSLITTGNLYPNLGFPPGYSGTFVYQGQTYLLQEGIFNFTTPVFTLPNNTANQQTVNIPFTMTGTLEFRSLSAGIPNFIVPISSNGTAVLNFAYNSGNGFFNVGPVGTSSLTNLTYYFGSTDGNLVPTPTPVATPEPVPEPATILLLGTGLAGIIGLSRKRKSQKTS